MNPRRGISAAVGRAKLLAAGVGLILAACLAPSVLGGEPPAGAPPAPPAPAPPPAAPSRTAWDGVYSKDQIVRGRRVYNAQCARCHGEALGGGEDSPALVDEDFFKKWTGKTLGKLIEYTREEMPSDGPGKLSRKQCTDVTVYVLSLNGFPEGTADLEPNLDILNAILITPKK